MAIDVQTDRPSETYLDRVWRYSEDAFTLMLAAWFIGQRARVIERFLAERIIRANMDRWLLPIAENAGFRVAFEAFITQAVRRVIDTGLAQVRPRVIVMTRPPRMIIGQQPNVAEIIRRRASAEGPRVNRMNAVTRRAIRREIGAGLDRGYSQSEIARGVPSEGYRGVAGVVEETYKGRARTIARTELRLVANLSSIDAYKALGYDRLYCTDGPECGLRFHEDRPLARDRWYPIAIAIRYPTAGHPNCQRRWHATGPGMQPESRMPIDSNVRSWDTLLVPDREA